MCHIIRNSSLILISVLASTLTMSAPHAARAESSSTSIQPLMVFGTDVQIPGSGSLLVRSRDGVGMTLHAFGLTPGHVYTVWWAVFNKPKNCAGTSCAPADLPHPAVRAVVLYATGQIAGDDGTADFAAYRAAGDPSGSVLVGSAIALEQPLTADIHLVVRSHGAAALGDPDVLNAQLSTFNGGCPPNDCQNVQAAPHSQ